jgi:hypothetical protein
VIVSNNKDYHDRKRNIVFYRIDWGSKGCDDLGESGCVFFSRQAHQLGLFGDACVASKSTSSCIGLQYIVQSTLNTEVVKIIEVAMGWPEVAVTKLATKQLML